MNRRALTRNLGRAARVTILLAASCGAVVANTPYPQSRRNVLLIVVDDVGVDKISVYVHHYNGTARSDDDMPVVPPDAPNIESLALAGVTFLNAWSSPTCSPTRAGLYTGLYASHNGVFEVGDELGTGLTTIAEALGAAGFASGLFGKWHLGESDIPDSHGWETFRGSLGGELEDYREWTKTEVSSTSSRTDDWSYDYATFVNVDDTVDWIRSQSGPWMATVAFNAPHWVLVDTDGDGRGDLQTLIGQEPENAEGCAGSTGLADEDAIYDEILTCADVQIGRLLTEIGSTELLDTTIIFMGDNGTDRNRTDMFVDPNRGAKGSVYEGGVNVPLIVADGHALFYQTTGTRIGRVVSPDRKVEGLVQTVDLFATIAAIAGASAGSATDSVSLIPLLENTATQVRSHAFTETESDMAVRNAYHKLVVKTSEAETTCQLFNLSNDRWEATDLLGDGANATESLHVTLLQSKIKSLSGRSVSCPGLAAFKAPVASITP